MLGFIWKCRPKASVIGLCIGVLLLHNVHKSTSLVIKAQHENVLTTESKDLGYTASVMCLAPEPLTACQFLVQDRQGSDFRLIDLTNGKEAGTKRISQIEYDSTAFRAKYIGNGLKKGHCGLTLTGDFLKERSFLVSCRGRGVKGGWAYDTVRLNYDRYVKVAITRKPNRSIYQPGEEVTINCNINERAISCNVAFHPDNTETLLSVFMNTHHKYKEGECGRKLTKITRANNGPIRCDVGFNYERISTLTYAVVAQPPTRVKLTASTRQQTLTATCRVANGRPAPVITWLLDGRPIRSSSEDDVARDEWRWPWTTQNLTQTISRKVSIGDNGKVLICRAEVDGFWKVEKRLTLKV